jgi:hypothetical protein
MATGIGVTATPIGHGNPVDGMAYTSLHPGRGGNTRLPPRGPLAGPSRQVLAMSPSLLCLTYHVR